MAVIRRSCVILSTVAIVVAFAYYLHVATRGDDAVIRAYKAINVGILGVVAISLSVACQLILFRVFGDRLKRRTLLAVILLLPATVVCGKTVYSTLPSARANRILSIARLPDVPKGAVDVRSHSWSFIFSGEDYVMFRASPEVLEGYLREASSILASARYQVYGSQRMRLYYPEDYSENLVKYVEQGFEGPEDFNEYIPPRYTQPSWYNGEIQNGRRYEFDVKRYQFPGELILDLDDKAIYVRLIFS